MTKHIYRLYTREGNEKWKERNFGFNKPDIKSWRNPNLDVKITIAEILDEERVIESRMRSNHHKEQVTYCEQCMGKIKYGDLVHIYTEYFPDLDDGHAIEEIHVFCCKQCANTFLTGKTTAYGPTDRFEYNQLGWQWEEEEKADKSERGD